MFEPQPNGYPTPSLNRDARFYNDQEKEIRRENEVKETALNDLLAMKAGETKTVTIPLNKGGMYFKAHGATEFFQTTQNSANPNAWREVSESAWKRFSDVQLFHHFEELVRSEQVTNHETSILEKPFRKVFHKLREMLGGEELAQKLFDQHTYEDHKEEIDTLIESFVPNLDSGVIMDDPTRLVPLIQISVTRTATEKDVILK